MIIPREIAVHDFEIMLNLLNKDAAAKFNDMYEKDENDYSRSFVLKDGVEENSDAVEELVSICDCLLHKCFEGEKFLWKYFQPGSSKNLLFLPVLYFICHILQTRKCFGSILVNCANILLDFSTNSATDLLIPRMKTSYGQKSFAFRGAK